MKKGEIWVVNIPVSDGHEQHGTRPVIVLADTPSSVVVGIPCTTNMRALRFGSYNRMKTKEELLSDYRDLVENNALHKDTVFLEVLIDIRDAVSALQKEMHTKQDGPERSTG